jgi:sugar lactone lactonase YvrE
MQITRLDVPQCSVGEGPVWDAEMLALFWIDILGKRVHKLTPVTGTVRSWDVPDVIGSMAIAADGNAIVALASGVHSLNLETGACNMLATSPDLNDMVQLADGKVDRRGRFIVGSSDRTMKDARGKLYALDPGANELREIDDGITLSNGPCWSVDDGTFYHADSILKLIFAYDYDIATGTLANKRTFASTEDLGGIPDGATVDNEDHVWSAICEGAKLVRFRPDGIIDRIVDMPVKLPGSVMFGGPALDQLYVPSLSPAFMGREADPLDGSTFVVEGLGVIGIQEARFGA